MHLHRIGVCLLPMQEGFAKAATELLAAVGRRYKFTCLVFPLPADGRCGMPSPSHPPPSHPPCCTYSSITEHNGTAVCCARLACGRDWLGAKSFLAQGGGAAPVREAWLATSTSPCRIRKCEALTRTSPPRTRAGCDHFNSACCGSPSATTWSPLDLVQVPPSPRPPPALHAPSTRPPRALNVPSSFTRALSLLPPSTRPPRAVHAPSTCPPRALHASSTRPPRALHVPSSFTRALSLLPPSTRPRSAVHAPSTCPPRALHASSTRPPRVLHASSMRPPRVLHASSTRPPRVLPVHSTRPPRALHALLRCFDQSKSCRNNILQAVCDGKKALKDALESACLAYKLNSAAPIQPLQLAERRLVQLLNYLVSEAQTQYAGTAKVRVFLLFVCAHFCSTEIQACGERLLGTPCWARARH